MNIRLRNTLLILLVILLFEHLGDWEVRVVLDLMHCTQGWLWGSERCHAEVVSDHHARTFLAIARPTDAMEA